MTDTPIKSLNDYVARIRSSDLGSRLLSGTAWSLTGSVVSRALNLLAIVIVARMLGRELFGEFGVVRATLNMFVAIAGAGLGLTATRFVASLRDTDKLRARNILSMSRVMAIGFGVTSAILLFVFSGWLATYSLDAPHLTPLLQAAAVFILLACINGVQNGALAGFESFRRIASIKMVVGLVTLPAMVLGTWFMGILGAIWGLNFSMLISCLLGFYMLKREAGSFSIDYGFRGWSQELGIFWKFSLPAAAATMMMGPVLWLCNAILVNQEDGYSEAGLFTAAMTFNALLLFVGGAMNAPLMSMISRGDNSDNVHLEKLNMLASWIIGSIVALPLLCFPEVPTAIFGEDFEGDTFRNTFNYVVVFTCMMLYKQGLFRVLAAKKLMWWSIVSNGLWAIILLVSAWFLARSMGAAGLAISFVIAYALNILIFIPFYTRRKLVPPGTISSLPAAGIWVTIIVVAILSTFPMGIGLRTLMFGIASLTCALLFRKLITS